MQFSVPPSPLRTQVGGKFHESNSALFACKKRLQAAGISVSYPRGDGIVAYASGMALTFKPEKRGDVLREEIAYLRSISKSSFHFVFNQFQDQAGYVGHSASVEMAYAVMHLRPIVLAFPLALSAGVPPKIRSLLTRNERTFHVFNPLEADLGVITHRLSSLSSTIPKYCLEARDRFNVYSCLLSLARLYRT